MSTAFVDRLRTNTKLEHWERRWERDFYELDECIYSEFFRLINPADTVGKYGEFIT
jgi:hypothetical protein